MSIPIARQSKLHRYSRTGLKIISVTLVAVVILEVLLQLIFTRLPIALTGRMPQYPTRYGINFDTPHGAREYPANEEVNLTVTQFNGDLYQLTCLSPADAPETEPYIVQYTRDEHGFRNPMPWPDDIDIAITGDSFTAAETIQHPYWENLAPSMLAFGLPGSGSLEQSVLLRTYGLPRSPEIVIMAYFGGNDVQDTIRFHRAQTAGETLYLQANRERRPWEYLVTFHLALLGRDLLTRSSTAEPCVYPITDSQNTPLAFYSEFLSFATIPADSLRESEGFSYTRDAIITTATEAHDSGAVFILVYIPFKAQVHWHLLSDEQILQIGAATQVLIQSGDGFEAYPAETDGTTVAQRITQNMGAQRILLAETATENGFLFLDLTPYFQEAASAGIATYFFGDTHWNQTGHNLAGRVLRDFLTEEGLLSP